AKKPKATTEPDIFSRAAPAALPVESHPSEKPSRIEIKFQAEQVLAKKPERAREVLSHKFPEGRLEDIIGETVDLFLLKHDPMQAQPKGVKKPSAPKKAAPKNPRRFGKRATAEITQAAGARCSFRSADGVWCAETRFLVINHKIPYAMGGSSRD